MSNEGIASLVYLLVALVIFGGAAAAASRQAKAFGAKGPGVMTSLLVWIAIIALVTALYAGAQFWSAALSMLR